jgi:hypothetical protein
VNEGILFTLAEIAIALAGFSGIVAAFRISEAKAWSSTERRILWLLISDSFIVLFFSLLPLPLSLWNWSDAALWGLCNALLGSWFFIGDILALRGERQDREKHELITVPLITPLLYMITIVAIVMGIALWLSVFNFGVPSGQAMYVLGLIVLLVFGALEFLFFIGLASKQGKK